jgi:primosomal replication protein N
VVLSGDDLIQVAATLAVGLQIRAEGFIARAGIKGEARDRLQLHAQSLTRLE